MALIRMTLLMDEGYMDMAIESLTEGHIPFLELNTEEVKVVKK